MVEMRKVEKWFTIKLGEVYDLSVPVSLTFCFFDLTFFSSLHFDFGLPKIVPGIQELPYSLLTVYLVLTLIRIYI